MQIIFMSKQKPEDYKDKDGSGEYPAAPMKCPYGDCGINLEMKKNGYYSRLLVTLSFSGMIKIRRYKCLKCGRTLSMLPSFCLAKCTYGVEFIITLLQYVIDAGSIRKTVMKWLTQGFFITRRLIRKYMIRLRNNRRLIQYGMNQLSPGNINLGRPPGDAEWTKNFLGGIRPTLCPEFNANFHKATGKSFMSYNNKVA